MSDQNDHRDLWLSYLHDVKHHLLRTQAIVDRYHNVDSSRRRELIELLERSISPLLLRTNNLALFEKQRTDVLNIQRHKMPIWDIVREAVDLHRPLYESKGVSLESDLAPPGPVAKVDVALFPTVLHNLLQNALEHSPPEESVRVEGAHDERSISIRVLDRGPGIPGDEWESIFHPARLRQTRRQHLAASFGIGLSVSKRIAEAHGAELRVEDAPTGFKTCFVVEIPRAQS